MVEWLYKIDVAVFTWINQKATHPWLDVFFRNITDLHKNRIAVVALFVGLLYFSIRKYKKEAWRPILVILNSRHRFERCFFLPSVKKVIGPSPASVSE